MLVIYDSTSRIYFQGSGYPDPTGIISYMNIEIPDGQYLDSIDMTGDTPTPIFKEYPPSKMELLEEDNIKQQADIDYLMLLLE